MFADDTTNIKCKQKGNPLIVNDMGGFSKWLADDKLTVIVEKSEAMVFGSNQPHDVFQIWKALTYQKSCKNTGTHLGSVLRFSRKNFGFLFIRIEDDESFFRVLRQSLSIIWYFFALNYNFFGGNYSGVCQTSSSIYSFCRTNK